MKWLVSSYTHWHNSITYFLFVPMWKVKNDTTLFVQFACNYAEDWVCFHMLKGNLSLFSFIAVNSIFMLCLFSFGQFYHFLTDYKYSFIIRKLQFCPSFVLHKSFHVYLLMSLWIICPVENFKLWINFISNLFLYCFRLLMSYFKFDSIGCLFKRLCW